MPDGREVVMLSLEAWDEVWRRNQFLVDGLLRREPTTRILFVEPAADPLHSIRSGRGLVRGRGVDEVPGYDSRLLTFQPTKWLPRLAGPAADSILRHDLRGAIRAVGMADPLLWVNDPSWAPVVRHTGWPALYDITDDWLDAHRIPREHDRLVRHERLLMDLCREVVVCSPELLTRKSRSRDVTLIPNAVDTARFRTPAARPSDLPQPTYALYVGTLHEDRLDVDLCLEIGDRLFELGAVLAMVGPNALSDENSARLARHRGVAVMGPRPNVAIPGYLQHASALVVPHIVDDFTDSLDPIKLYEYEAVERPIAATPVAGFRDLAGRPGVTIAASGEFADQLSRVMTTPPALVGPFAVPDWGERVTAMQDVLSRVLR